MDQSNRNSWAVKKGRAIGLVVLALLFLCAAAAIPALTLAFGEKGPTPRLAPPNPAFIEYMETSSAPNQLLRGSSCQTTGLIPSPVDRSHLAEGPDAALLRHSLLRGQLPSRYDLRDHSRLTPVRDQGDCGACWAFPAMAGMESRLLDLSGEERNFSENHLKNTSGFDLGHCAGGNYDMALAYLARWGGPVNEAEDPYDPTSDISPAGLTARKHVQQVKILPPRRTTADNSTIKEAVMNFGALASAMHWSWHRQYYNEEEQAYYFDGDGQPNHAVSIVGWDDDYPRENFKKHPPGDGAFIVRNSWGDTWGDGGYFYISYHDRATGTMNVLFNNAENTSNFSGIYQYDYLGWIDSLGYGSGTDTAWAANLFTARALEDIVAISFYAVSWNASYSLYIYTSANDGPRSGVRAAGPVRGTFEYPGYYTVELPEPVRVFEGQTFSIVIAFTTPGYGYPVAIESPFPGYSSPSANPGESYMSPDGNRWVDVADTFENTSVCIKAFTLPSDAGYLLPSIVSLDPSSVNKGSGPFTLTINGEGFVPLSQVRLNGKNRDTEYLSNQRITARIMEADVAETGVAHITVFNPEPGGGLSNQLELAIDGPPPFNGGGGSSCFIATISHDGGQAGQKHIPSESAHYP